MNTGQAAAATYSDLAPHAAPPPPLHSHVGSLITHKPDPALGKRRVYPPPPSIPGSQSTRASYLALGCREGAVDAQEAQLHALQLRPQDVQHHLALAEHQGAVPLGVQLADEGSHKQQLAG